MSPAKPLGRFMAQTVGSPLLVSGKGCFTVRTGQCAFRETASATLPIKSRLSPEKVSGTDIGHIG